MGSIVIPTPRDSLAGRIKLGREWETPYLLIDRARVRANVRRLRSAFPGAELFYAIKANPHSEVLRTLAAEGVGFEISSDGELDAILGVTPPAPLISSNPVKMPRFIGRAWRSGVQAFAVDSPEELRKVAREAPAATVYVRLLVDNRCSEWPLARKYGVEPAEAVDLLDQAVDLGLRARGTTFHVGSQCRSSESWRSALAVTASAWDRAAARGHRLDFLSLGGGFPIQHTRPIPEFEEIGAVVQNDVAALFPSNVALSLEPGRALIGDAALLGASVIGHAARADGFWVYLDVGIFNGLMEAIDGFAYEIAVDPRPASGPDRQVILAGPSCDSVDVIAESVAMPEVEVGDRVYILNAGAYTLSYASHFNGWAPPTVHLIDSEE